MNLAAEIHDKKHATLRRQLLSYFAISVIFVAVSASIVTAWQTSDRLKSSTIERGLQLASNFADQAVLALLTGSDENAQEAVSRALGFKSVSGVAIFKPDGNLLFSSAETLRTDFMINIDKLGEQAQLMDDVGSLWIFNAPVFFTDDEFDSDTVEPDEESLEKQLIGYVLVEYDKQELFEIQRSIFINNITIGGLAGLFLSIVMGFVINRLTKPLSMLSETMESARDSGNYIKAGVTGALEIQRMASTYNEMMSKLEKQNVALEMHKDTLESEVQIRTQELKVARDTALTANRHKSEFLANISHELRTPLQAIIGYTDLVKEDLELECMDAQVEDLNKCIRSAHSLLALINNILDLAKIEAGKMDLYLQEVDMAMLIEDTVETIEPMAKVNNNKIIVNRGVLADKLELDRQKIKQIFLNLLSNACKFTKNGDITFSLYSDNKFFYFAVSDTGVGIPKEQLDYIFEQFTQVDGSQTRKFEGTGLGMAITKNFVDLMDAEISVTSELDTGTEFKVRLPIPIHSMN